ncbi:MAG TPA: transglycosylase SLT domain-containing protein [Acetobacteraceae bacterium]|nr:transglycosylase SLT domain-containing protein [Acetobacteraceae bacterium]
MVRIAPLLLALSLLAPGSAASQGFGAPGLINPLLPGGLAAPLPAQSAGPFPASPGALCRAAIAAAEARHGIPAGLLQAIGMVESGRTDPATGARSPWPWTVDADGRGAFLPTKPAAIGFVRDALAGGAQFTDVGCMQVNLQHHPHAFASLPDAFDPYQNAEYAARFLRELHDGPAGGDWMRAAGFYHSQTPDLAEPYRRQVQAAMHGAPIPSGGADAMFASASAPPRPGGGGQSLLGGRALRFAMPAGTIGRGLSAYRGAPILVSGYRYAAASPPPLAR